jgi:hypothetical protein
MAARLTYSGTPFYDQIMKEGFKAGKPTGGFSTRLADYFQSGPKTFSSPSKGVASLYGRTIPMLSSTSNLRLPSGGIPGKTLGEALRNLTGTRVGTEVIQTPKQANKGMDIARKALDRANRGVSSTASRLLAGEAVSGIGASQAGRSVLGRVLGAALGPAATYASALTAPNVIMASMLDGPNVRSGAADEYVGLMGEAMPEEDYAGLGDLLGVPEASQALDDEYYDFDKAPYSELDDFEAQNAGQFVPEEGKGIGELLQNLSGGAVNFGKDILGRQIASQALGGAGGMIFGPVGAIAGGITGLLGGGGLFDSNSLSQRTFDSMTPGQQQYTSGLYNPGGLLEGYNQISAFGKGAIGTLGDRLTSIQNRKAPQTAASLARQQQIKDAIDRSINIGESEALGSDDTSVDYGITGGRTRTDIDVADGGAETSGGKIVCTMMNESYGFGNFRNKIWLKHSKNLPKEYEIGYHKIFLPLVKFAKRKGKLNKAVKKTLEHVARHRTLDLKQEMKGKTHILGRVYRKILEPICFIVGKVSNND